MIFFFFMFLELCSCSVESKCIIGGSVNFVFILNLIFFKWVFKHVAI